jgi:predicted ester cyclase
VDIEDLIPSGDRVVARVRFSGTQTGERYGRPATGIELV